MLGSNLKGKDRLISCLALLRYPQMPPFYLLRSMWWSKSNGLEILVIGAGRGGTSILASLLDAHSQLEVHMEAAVPEYLVSPDRQRFPQVEDQLKAFIKANKQLAQGTKLRFGNKITTEQLGFVENFGADLAARELMTDLLLRKRKIIFIIRDGRTCISSKLARTNADYPTALNYWKHSVNLWQYLQEQDLDILTVKFEDLLANPREELVRVCGFLDITYSESMLSGTASDRILVDYRRKGLEKERAQRPVHSDLKVSDIQKELTILGYV